MEFTGDVGSMSKVPWKEEEDGQAQGIPLAPALSSGRSGGIVHFDKILDGSNEMRQQKRKAVVTGGRSGADYMNQYILEDQFLK